MIYYEVEPLDYPYLNHLFTTLMYSGCKIDYLAISVGYHAQIIWNNIKIEFNYWNQKYVVKMSEKKLGSTLFSFQVVSRLCRCLESVFSHGLKSPSKQNSTLKQMTDLVSNNLGGFLLSQSATAASSITGAGSTSAPVLWSFIKVHLNRHELER